MHEDGYGRGVGEWTHALEAELDALRQRDEVRSLEVPSGFGFCSNDYLELSKHPALRAATLAAAEKSTRLGGTASRLLAGQTAGWHDLEEEFAEFAGTEAALFFTSGYMANVGLLSSIAGPGDIVFSDECNHASLIDGIRLSGAETVIYRHADMSALESALTVWAGAAGKKLIITETVFSMDGDLAPLVQILGWLNALARQSWWMKRTPRAYSVRKGAAALSNWALPAAS